MMKKNYLAPCAEVMLFAPSESIASSQPWWNWSWKKYTAPDNVSATDFKTLIQDNNQSWVYGNKDKPY